MFRKNAIFLFALVLTIGLLTPGFAAKVPAPETGGPGFKAVNLKEARKLIDEGAVVIACHSHTTDYLKMRVPTAKHITCMVPKKHKFTNLPLDEVDFNVMELPKDKNTPIITYCAGNT